MTGKIPTMPSPPQTLLIIPIFLILGQSVPFYKCSQIWIQPRPQVETTWLALVERVKYYQHQIRWRCEIEMRIDCDLVSDCWQTKGDTGAPLNLLLCSSCAPPLLLLCSSSAPPLLLLCSSKSPLQCSSSPPLHSSYIVAHAAHGVSVKFF